MQRLNQQGFRKTGCLTAQHHATAPFASPRSPAAAAGAPAYGRPQSARPHFARYGAAPAAAATTAAHSTDDDDLSVQGSAVSPVKAAAVPLPPRVRPASAAAAAYTPRSTAAATLPAGGWASSVRTPSFTGGTSASATVAATAGNGARSGAADSAQQHEWSDEEESIGESPFWQSDSPRGAERSSGASPSYMQNHQLQQQQNQQQQQQQQLQEVEDDEWRVAMGATSAGPVNRGARGCRGVANPLLDPYRTTGGLALEYTAQSRRREVQATVEQTVDKPFKFNI
jgi:hypothetical protein